MKKTGAILKKAREEKGLSLHEIGLSLKINSKVLRAIEEGDESSLPAKTFLRGFVQSYSNYLHLDTDKVLQAFYEEMGSTTPQPFIRENTKERSEENSEDVAPEEAPLAKVEPIKEAPKKETKAETQKPEVEAKPAAAVENDTKKDDGLQSLQDNKIKKSVGWFVVAALLFVLIVFTKKMIDKYSKEAEVPSAEVAQTMEGATPVFSEPNEDDIGDAEIAQSEAPLTSEPTSGNTSANSEPVSTPNSSTPPKEVVAVTTPEPKKEEKPAAPVAPAPAVTPAPTPAKPEPVAEAAPAKPEEKPSTPDHKPVELIVEALDAVEIEYSSATGKSQKIKLSSEQVHTFKSRSGLKINFSNGGAVNLILNGRDVGIPGDLGKPIRLTY